MPIHPNGLPDFMLEPLNVWYRRWLRRVGFNWMPEGFQRYCGLVWIAKAVELLRNFARLSYAQTVLQKHAEEIMTTENKVLDEKVDRAISTLNNALVFEKIRQSQLAEIMYYMGLDGDSS